MKTPIALVLVIVSVHAQVPQGQANHGDSSLSVYAGGYPIVWPPALGYLGQPGPFVFNVPASSPLNSVVAARVFGLVGSYFEVYAHSGPTVASPYWHQHALWDGWSFAVHLNANNLWNGGQPVLTGTIPQHPLGTSNHHFVSWAGPVTSPTYHYSVQAIVYHPSSPYGYRLTAAWEVVR